MKAVWTCIALVVMLLGPEAALAQTTSTSPAAAGAIVAPPAPQTPIVPPVALPPAPAPLELTELADGVPVPVFGTQLFTGAFSAARPTKGPDYLIQPGDQIAVRIYGAVNVDAVQVVDGNGALFIQGIGPVNVGGAPASSLQSRLATALRSVYTDTVGVYVDILQGGSLGVFVTGDVRRPGRYLGSTGDSVLFFLDQAGGIDPGKGSFRNVTVMRNGQPQITFDLYDFIIRGQIANFVFKNGDVIHIGRRGAMVGVTGDAISGYAFEARAGSTGLSGAEIVALSRPTGTVSSIGVTSVRNGLGQSAYYSLTDFSKVMLSDGDHVILRSDIFTQSISVSLQGDLRGPSIFVLPRGAKLSQLLAQVPLEGSDVEASYVHIERPSVALQQKEALDRALDNLEKAALTAPATTSETAAIAAGQASQLERFVARARQVEPSGKVAVYTNGQFHDLKLESGDKVIFPNRSDVVLVAGEAVSPGAFVFADGQTIRDYVNRAGGFAPNANKSRFALRRPDGSAVVAKAGDRPRPGDEIVVVPSIVNPGFLLFKDITTIVFQIATTAAAAINISN